MRSLLLSMVIVTAGAFGLLAVDRPEKPKKATPLPKLGVKTPGVQIPMASLKSEAEIAVEGSPAALLFAEQVMLSNGTKIIRIDPKTNRAVEPFTGFDKPCGGLVSAFESVWVPNCGNGTLSRIEPKTGKVTATIEVAVAGVAIAIAAGPDSIWLLSDERTTLSRIDPTANSVVAEVRVEAGCNSVVFAESALWLTCPTVNKVIRVDPRTNLATKRIEVAAKPISLAFGESSIWVLCQTDGKVARIDPKTDKVTATIEMGIPNAEGNIAFGEGSVWVSTTGFPISRIQPVTDKVVQQFTGEIGGMVQVGLKSVWLVERKSGKVLRFDPKRVAATISD